MTKFEMVRQYMARNYGLKLEHGVHWSSGYSVTGIFPDGKSGKIRYNSLKEVIRIWMQDGGVDILSYEYYSNNYESFVDRTKNRDMTELYLPFISHIPSGGQVLDAGCGSGRDSMAFADMGFKVVAIDACPYVIQKEVLKNENVKFSIMGFEDVKWCKHFDGVWASNSLLHVPPDSFGTAVDLLYDTLKPNGVMYMSFYHGDHTKTRRCTRGRLFTDQNHDSLTAIARVLGANIKQIQTVYPEGIRREAIYCIMQRPSETE